MLLKWDFSTANGSSHQTFPQPLGWTKRFQWACVQTVDPNHTNVSSLMYEARTFSLCCKINICNWIILNWKPRRQILALSVFVVVTLHHLWGLLAKIELWDVACKTPIQFVWGQAVAHSKSSYHCLLPFFPNTFGKYCRGSWPLAAYHPAALDWLPIEAKQGWERTVPGWETSWRKGSVSFQVAKIDDVLLWFRC